MKKFILIIVFMLLASVSIAAEAVEKYSETDQEMIQLLDLNPGQAQAYVAIIQKQRALFLSLKSLEWQQELAFYQQTFALLKPVLSPSQYFQFVGIINSVIEQSEHSELLVMGEEYH